MLLMLPECWLFALMLGIDLFCWLISKNCWVKIIFLFKVLSPGDDWDTLSGNATSNGEYKNSSTKFKSFTAIFIPYLLFCRGGWMIFYFSIVQVHFIFCQLNFIELFPFLIKYYHILCIIIVFRLGNDKLVSCFFYCLSQGISYGMWLLAWGRVDDFSFSIIQVHLNSLYFLHLLYSTNMLCLLLLYLIWF